MVEVILTVHSPGGIKQVPVTGDHLSLGRSEAVSLCIDDPGLSRLHASIHREGDRVWILDEGSTNGSYVNSQQVPAMGRPLADGDKISVGDHTTIWVSISRPKIDRIAEQPKTRAGFPLFLTSVSIVILVILVGMFGSRLLNSNAESHNEDRNANMSKESPSNPPQPSIPPPSNGNSNSSIEIEPPSRPPSPRKLYKLMTQDEQMEFIKSEAKRISKKMGNRPCEFTEGALRRIKQFVDGYVSRVDRGTGRSFREPLRLVFKRATRFAPLIIRSFNEHDLYPEVGLYMAMVESEYHMCLTSPAGARGMFQFMPGTAITYGIDPKYRCDEEKMAPAAARYFRFLIGQFGTDATSVALAIASYNRGEGNILSDMHKVIDSGGERGFWRLVEKSKELPKPFQKETINYVPKFFAAAIIGESPKAFGLDIEPLSTYAGETNHR